VIHLVGNLDCERAWRGLPAPPAHVAARIAALATLMRALVDADEVTVWTPVAIDPGRIPPIAGLPRVRLAAGAPPAGATGLAWGATDVDLAPPPAGAITSSLDASVRRALAAHAASVDVARVVNDRRLARRFDDPLAGGVMTAIDDAVLADAAAASPTSTWLAKATLTAAGRARVRGTLPVPAAIRTRLDRLLAAGPVVVEPWLDRTHELGVIVAVPPGGGETAFAPHTLLSDTHGTFRGIDLAPPPLSSSEIDRLRTAATAVHGALAARQYRGPAAFDAFRHTRGLRPVVEINARLTFGLVARALFARLSRTSFRVGTDPPPDALLLVAPAPDDPSAAWLV
jgi:hypothetical protein